MPSSSSASRRIVLWGLLGLGIAIASQFLLVLQEIPVSVNEIGFLHDDDHPKIGDHAYAIVDLRGVPSSTGPIIKVLSYLVTQSPLAPFVARFFLNTNGIHRIRELAAQHCRKLPPTHFPIHKASEEEMERGRSWTEAHGAAVREHGLELSRSNDDGDNKGNTKIDPAPGYRSIMDYNTVYQSRKATPSQVIERLIFGAEQKLPQLRIFACFRPDRIRQQAKESDRRWAAGTPLSVWDGVPVAIKDMSPVAGLSLCDGSSVCQEMTEDDFPAEQLRRAGAIIVGMTVMTEGGVTPLGYSVFFDGPFNPYDMNFYSGGSSGGSAVAVASGLVPMAVGWDGGGSVRIPASMSGVLGLATTWGRIPFRFSSSSTNVKAGPLAATMTDVALSYLLLSESHPDSFYTDLLGSAYLPPPHLAGVPLKNTSSSSSSSSDDMDTTPFPSSYSLQGTRLGVYWDHFQHTDLEVYQKCLQVVRYLEDRGAEIVNITIPHLREIHLSHGIKILSEFGIVWESQFYNKSYALEANTEITVMLGRTIKADEVLAAEKVRSLAIEHVRKRLFRDLQLDAIVSPMLGGKVPQKPKGHRGFGESNNPLVFKTMRFAPLANFLGLPGLSVPVGYEEETGLPIGFQLLGDAWSEPTLIRLGCVVEHFQTRRKPPSANFFDVLAPWLSNQQ